MAAAETEYYCHKCRVHIGHVINFQCPHCHDSFIEELLPDQSSSRSRQSDQSHSGERTLFHNSSPFGNTTIFIGGGHPGNSHVHRYENQDMGMFFQNVLQQIGGVIVGAGEHQSPFAMHSVSGPGMGEALNLEAFLTQFLNQLGENSGPAPASENRINTIPTVKVTAEQARDSLQCAICMDDFNENDEAKRLPCSHHFHEACISRWLRMHGTCPTCRVTLDGDNTANREYYNIFPEQNQSSANNNRRNDGNNDGSSSGAGAMFMDFD
ncbi:unnamed protein product [Adineta ricciae]|uniref:RING-type E3 ubiquitin transferase n=1 Tax=Adineta ricciae TaxID=249248 RepID=A0A815P0Q3_ADIRI|nr:unnamed protein product [Adineta ricciae]